MPPVKNQVVLGIFASPNFLTINQFILVEGFTFLLVLLRNGFDKHGGKITDGPHASPNYGELPKQTPQTLRASCQNLALLFIPSKAGNSPEK